MQWDSFSSPICNTLKIRYYLVILFKYFYESLLIRTFFSFTYLMQWFD